MLEEGNGRLKYPSDVAATRRIRDPLYVPRNVLRHGEVVLNPDLRSLLRIWWNSINFLNFYSIIATDSETFAFFSVPRPNEARHEWWLGAEEEYTPRIYTGTEVVEEVD